MKIGNREFLTSGKTYIMGILNVTPDSFSDGGKWFDRDAALRHAEEMLAQGADILDIGGESTRPGHTRIGEEEEIARVVPVIEAVKRELGAVISVDTYKAAVAREAILAGADLVNDIWGLKGDAGMASVIARAGVPCCLMHNRREPVYRDYLKEVLSDLQESVQLGLEAGIDRGGMILDPGIGFGKDYRQNLKLLRHLDLLHDLGYPVLLGTSRKSVIGLTLNLPADQREEGTLATTVMAVEKGCMFVRVHNVEANARAVRMTEAILQA